MIKIGFIKDNDKAQSLEIFNQICINIGLKLNTNISNFIDNMDIMSISLNYHDFLYNKYNFINFDIIVFENSCFIEENIENKILNNIPENSILIINCDDKKIFKFLKGIKGKVITYGLNSKSCITTSSMQDNEDILQELLCCIQRMLPTFNSNTIEPQEFKIRLKKYKKNDIYDSLAAISASLICDIKIENIEKIIL